MKKTYKYDTSEMIREEVNGKKEKERQGYKDCILIRSC